MNVIEKIRLYCGINEVGRISDSDFKGLVRDAMGLTNKKSVSSTAKIRVENYAKTDAYKRWVQKYFPSDVNESKQQQDNKNISKTDVVKDITKQYISKISTIDKKRKEY